MSEKRLKIIHFHNGSGGGVLSVIRNLLAYRQHPEIENHVIYTINTKQRSAFSAPGLTGATSEQVFYYNPQWNFYHTCRQLAKLLPGQDAVIVAHDWLELGMVSNLGLQNPVVHYVHGDYDYYYQLAYKHAPWVNAYVCVAASISEGLKQLMPNREADIHYLRFPVPSMNAIASKMEGFHIVFAGRCEYAKGYFLLPEINKLLLERGLYVQWHIAGPGSDKADIQAVWGGSPQVQFYGNLSQSALHGLLMRTHAFVLPSHAEGMPVSVVEAMKAGNVQVVNNLKGGIQELVHHGKTGFLIDHNDPQMFASYLQMIIENKNLWHEMAENAKNYAVQCFDPSLNTHAIEEFLLTSLHHSNQRKPGKIYGSRLDQPWLPNSMVYGLRSLSSQLAKHGK